MLDKSTLLLHATQKKPFSGFKIKNAMQHNGHESRYVFLIELSSYFHPLNQMYKKNLIWKQELFFTKNIYVANIRNHEFECKILIEFAILQKKTE